MAVNFKMNTKKAMFFSLIAILTISLFILAYKSTTTQTTYNKVPIVEQRVQMANQVLDNLQNIYINEIIQVSLKNAFHGYHKYLIDEGKFDSNKAEMIGHIKNLITTGEISSKTYNEYTLIGLMDEVVDKVNESMKLELDYKYSNIDVYQNETTGPWYIGIKAHFDLYLNATAATWNTSKDYDTFIYIKDLYDPYHSLNTYDVTNKKYVKRKILPSTQSSWNTASFTSFVKNGEYNFNNNSPSFFGRLVNDSSSSDCCGIETFITEDSLYHRPGGTLGGYLNVSFSDVCYFNDDSSSTYCGPVKNKVKDLSTDYSSNDLDYPFTASSIQLGYYNVSSVDSKIR